MAPLRSSPEVRFRFPFGRPFVFHSESHSDSAHVEFQPDSAHFGFDSRSAHPVQKDPGSIPVHVGISHSDSVHINFHLGSAHSVRFHSGPCGCFHSDSVHFEFQLNSAQSVHSVHSDSFRQVKNAAEGIIVSWGSEVGGRRREREQGMGGGGGGGGGGAENAVRIKLTIKQFGCWRTSNRY